MLGRERRVCCNYEDRTPLPSSSFSKLGILIRVRFVSAYRTEFQTVFEGKREKTCRNTVLLFLQYLKHLLWHFVMIFIAAICLSLPMYEEFLKLVTVLQTPPQSVHARTHAYACMDPRRQVHACRRPPTYINTNHKMNLLHVIQLLASFYFSDSFVLKWYCFLPTHCKKCT